MSVDAHPGAIEQLADGRDGPDPHHGGVDTCDRRTDEAPSGSIPSASAVSSLAITSAAAPSLIPLELPAVTVPSRGTPA